jgi:phage/plasmid-like protein (TIGR03299 family)
MAHHLTSKDTMLSVGATPWHGLGVVLANPPTIAEAIKLARLDWRVETSPNFTMVSGDQLPTPSKSIIRVDTDASGIEMRSVIASVGPTYEPLQNAAAFAWFQPWLDSGRVTLETAGSLMGGTRIWILARIVGDPIVVQGDDVVEKYILLAHAHDGSLAIRAGLTPIRVVCHNTLSAAIGLDPSTGKPTFTPDGVFKILHRSGAQAKLDDVAAKIEQIDARLNAAGEAYRFLASREVLGGDDRLVEFVGGVYGQTDEQVRKGRRLPEIARLFESGIGQDLPGAKGTHWGLVNAITEYTTHHAGRDAESRANGGAFGAGATANRRALDVAMVMAQKTYTVAEVFGEFSPTNTGAIAEHPDALPRFAG